MTIIRRLSYLDGFKLKKMIAFLGNDEAERFTKILMNNSCDLIHRCLPLKFKFLPEAFVLEENNELHGMITIAPTKGNPYKLIISKLLFEQNYFDVGKQLVEFVVSKYGAKGAETFMVSIDDNHDELLDLFSTGCGFRQCASELLYKIPQKEFKSQISQNIIIRPFKNSDCASVALIHNNSVINHFRPSLLKNKSEFKELFFQGISNLYELNYVMEDISTNTLLAYFSIITFDNINYTLHLTLQEGYEIEYNKILGFVNRELKRRKKNFNLFVKVRKYMKNSEELEKYLQKKDGTCIRTQIILIKDFYKIIPEKAKNLKMIMFQESNNNAVIN